LFIQNRYRATARLVVQVSSIGVHTVNKTELPYDIYWSMFANPETLNSIIDEFNLDESPYNMESHRDLENRIEITSERDAPMFTISVTMEDSKLAADIANQLAQDAKKTSLELQQQEIERSTNQLIDQLRSISEEMNMYRQNYLAMLKENKKQILINEMDVNNTIIATLKQQINTLNHSIVENQTRMKGYEKVFSSTDFTPTIELKKSLLADALALEAARADDNPDNLAQISEMQIVDEHLNGSYQQLMLAYKQLQVEMPAQIEARDSMQGKLEELEKKVIDQQTRLYEMEVEEQIGKQDFDRAIEVLGGIDKQVGWVGTTVTTERLDVYQVGKAIPDDKKVYPQRSIIVAVIGMIAFLVSFIYYLLLDLYGLVKTGIRKDEEQEA